MLSLHLYFLARWLLLTWKRLLPTGIRPTRTGNMAPCLYLRSHCTGFCGFHCYCIPCIVSLQHLKVKRVQQTSFFEVKKKNPAGTWDIHYQVSHLGNGEKGGRAWAWLANLIGCEGHFELYSTTFTICALVYFLYQPKVILILILASMPTTCRWPVSHSPISVPCRN